ncbi:MAG: RNA polymerase sigma factor [Flavobacteriales bacterium]
MKTTQQPKSEAELLAGCRRGDARCQREFYERFAGRMMAVCRRYGKDEDEAKDMLQEGFIRVFEKLDQYSGKGSLEGWIRMVVINHALIVIRRTKHYRNAAGLDDVQEFTSNEVGALQQLSQAELMQLVTEMPQGYRTVFNLFAIEGYPHKEIATMLGISESTSKTQYHKARAHLKKALTAQEKQPQ